MDDLIGDLVFSPDLETCDDSNFDKRALFAMCVFCLA